jgi:hypothetical protein
LDKAVDVGGFPFEVAFRVISGPDIGVEKELTGVDVWPVIRDCELGFSCFDGGDEVLEGAMFADQS